MEYYVGVEASLFLNLADGTVGVSGQTAVVTIQRESDLKWWNDESHTWSELPVDLSMTENDETNQPGLYVYIWIPDAVGIYNITYRIDSGDYETNMSECIVVTDIEDTVDTIAADMALDSTVAKDATVLKASTVVDGAFTVSSVLKELLAKATGNPKKVGDAYQYHDKATGALLFTLTIVGDNVTRS